jgi:hypothetical protein
MGAFETQNVISTPPALKRRGLRFVQTETNRHGVVCYYFRKDKQTPRVRLRSEPGTPEFKAEYDAALAGKSYPPSSFVYFAVAGNKVKIGVSKNPRQRLGELKTGSSSKVRIYYVTPGDRQKERQLHAQFADLRVNGEWFLFATAIRDWISADEKERLAARGMRA